MQLHVSWRYAIHYMSHVQKQTEYIKYALLLLH